MSKSFEIQIIEISELKYSFGGISTEMKNTISTKNIFNGIGFRFDILEQKEIVNAFCNLNYNYGIEGADDIEILDIAYEFSYRISNLSDFHTKIDDNSFDLNDSVMRLVISETLATMRGIISVRTAGTILQKYPFPLYDVDVLMDRMKKQAEPQKKITKKITKSKIENNIKKKLN